MLSKIYQSMLRSTVARSGNIFALLFGSVALVGILGVSSVSNLVIGDVSAGTGSVLPQPACERGPVGTVCSDGAIYAGIVDGIRFYAAPADEVGTKQWSNVYVNTGATSLTDGLYNTNILVPLGAGYQAATACRAKGSTWYLPSRDELNVMYSNRAAIGGFSTNWYWSSSEVIPINGYAWVQLFLSGAQNATFNKIHYANTVRCARR